MPGATPEDVPMRAVPVRTYTPKPGDIQRAWHVIDAEDIVLGRLASQAATLLRGTHKPYYAPHLDPGACVVVIPAATAAMTGNTGSPATRPRCCWATTSPTTRRTSTRVTSWSSSTPPRSR